MSKPFTIDGTDMSCLTGKELAQLDRIIKHIEEYRKEFANDG